MKRKIVAVWNTELEILQQLALMLLCTAILYLLIGIANVHGQVRRVIVDEPVPVDSRTQAEIIDSIAVTLHDIYVFPDVAEKMEQHIRRQYVDNAYAEINDLQEFCRALTEDLQSISKDRHLTVRYAPRAELERMVDDTLTYDVRREMLEQSKYDNFCFREVKRLPGNIGYLKFNCFSGEPEAGDIAVAAMNFVSNCGALIFDLRENGGGSPAMIQLISSYLFREPVHLNSFYIRKEDTIRQFWTQSHVVGRRMPDVPVYVLTSTYTFSGAEEFTYNLKNLERATVIGETTGGGAHPVEGHAFADLQVRMRVPYGRAVNPITGANWEGVGVTPHIEVPADQALDMARLEAMKKLKSQETDENIIADLEWVISGLQAKLNPITIDESLMREYAGDYGPRHIYFEDGHLYYQREERPRFRMIPLNEDTFGFEELDDFRLHFVRDEDGRVAEVVGRYDNGQTDRNPRN